MECFIIKKPAYIFLYHEALTDQPRARYPQLHGWDPGGLHKSFIGPLSLMPKYH